MLTAMRLHANWAATPLFLDEVDREDPLVQPLKILRVRLLEWSDIDWLQRITPLDYLMPFLEIVRSERANTLITGVALSALQKILSLGLVDQATPGAAEAVHVVANTIMDCRFEVTDSTAEDAVLAKILQVRVSVPMLVFQPYREKLVLSV